MRTDIVGGVSLVGQILPGGYRVVRALARGALATVYLTVGPEGQPFALKVFPKEAKARRDREFWVGQRLHHPRLNPVLQSLDLEAGPALLLAYAPGEELGRWLPRHPDRGQALGVFRQLLEALEGMHTQGLVHRDVKPENLIVSPQGEARLLDFDLSGPAYERFPRPLRVGTLPYLAPEQVLGQSPGPEADLYAAGVILYWILSGEHPFVGAPEEVLLGHLQGEAPPIPGLAPGEQAYLDRLLAKDPKARFPHAGEALKAFPFT